MMHMSPVLLIQVCTCILLVSYHYSLLILICRVNPNLQNVLRHLEKLKAPTNLIDPLKFYITAPDGTILDECVAAVKENEDHELKLENVFLNQRAKGIPQFNIMLPEK